MITTRFFSEGFESQITAHWSDKEIREYRYTLIFNFFVVLQALSVHSDDISIPIDVSSFNIDQLLTPTVQQFVSDETTRWGLDDELASYITMNEEQIRDRSETLSRADDSIHFSKMLSGIISGFRL